MMSDPGPLPDTVEDLLTGLLVQATDRRDGAVQALLIAGRDVETATHLLSEWRRLKYEGVTVQSLSSDVRQTIESAKNMKRS